MVVFSIYRQKTAQQHTRQRKSVGASGMVIFSIFLPKSAVVLTMKHWIAPEDIKYVFNVRFFEIVGGGTINERQLGPVNSWSNGLGESHGYISQGPIRHLEVNGYS